MQADVIGIVFFFVDQFILRCWRTDGVTPDLIRQQRHRMLANIVESPGVICPDKAGFNVIQQFRVPVTSYQFPDYENECRTGVGKENLLPAP